MRKKLERIMDERKVVYSDSRWKILNKKRKRAMEIIEIIDDGYVYGSVARGDVTENSDIDIIIFTKDSAFQVETSLLEHGENIMKREIIVATPNSVPKGHIYLNDYECIIVFLAKAWDVEEEFYKFGGIAHIDELISNKRIAGVDKRLMFINPIDDGHIEFSIIGRESEVAEKLKISIESVNERVRVLTRRDKIGRTGVFLKYVVGDDENFNSALSSLCRESSEIRRNLRKRGMKM